MISTTKSGRFLLGASARLIDSSDEMLRAWAEDHVRKDPHIKWILGNYVEAGRANSNGHIFKLDDLMTAQDTLIGKPLNMLHHDQYVVGAYAGSKLLTPNGETMTAELVQQYLTATAAEGAPKPTTFPYMEALAGMWHTRFKEEYHAIQRAHGEGSLFFSMEAVPPTVTCPDCAMTAAFDGLESDTYCEHMNGQILPKILDQPIFAGGAIIIPPVRPGWNRADVKAISELVTRETDLAEALYASAKELAPHLNDSAWETVMAMVLEHSAEARDFSMQKRKEYADKGVAMPGGEYPIPDMDALHRAMQAFGRAKPGDRAAVKQHIMKRAKALGAPTDVLERISQLGSGS